MKKVILMLVAVAGLTLASCGGNQTSEVSTADDAISTLSEKLQAGDAQAVQSTIEEVQNYIAELQASGKTEEAKTYVAKLQEWLDTNAEQVQNVVGDNATVNSVISAIKAIPTDVASEATDAATDAVEDLQQAGSDLKQAGEDLQDVAEAKGKAVKDAVDSKAKAVKDAVDAAPAAGKQAVEQAKQDAEKSGKDAVNKAIDNAAGKLKLK